jgi:hypothetical protein
MTEHHEVRVLYNKRDHITYFLNLREDREEIVSIPREELEIAMQMENCLIIIIIPNDINDSTKGATFYGLSAAKWCQYCEDQNGKSTVPMNRLRNLKDKVGDTKL